MHDVERLLFALLSGLLPDAAVYLVEIPQEVVAPVVAFEVRGRATGSGTARIYEAEIAIGLMAATREQAASMAEAVLGGLDDLIYYSDGVRVGPFVGSDEGVQIDEVTGLWANGLRWSALVVRG